MTVIANPEVTADLSKAADANQKADFVTDNQGNEKTELLYGKTGYFDWRKPKNVTFIRSGFTADFKFIGFEAKFGTGDVIEPQSLGDKTCDGTSTCTTMQIADDDCITNAIVSGQDHVRRIIFETKQKKQYIFGSTDGSLDRWNAVNKQNKCLTGIWGVYQKTGVDEQKALLSIGFYFESEQKAPTSNGGPSNA